MESMVMNLFVGAIYAAFLIILKAIGFLITHVDVVNSMLIGGLAEFFTMDFPLTSSSRWILFLAAFIVCEVIQYSFKIGRIIFTIFSVYAAGALSTMFMPRDTRPETIKIAIIWMLIIFVLNLFRWGKMKEEMRVSTPVEM